MPIGPTALRASLTQAVLIISRPFINGPDDPDGLLAGLHRNGEVVFDAVAGEELQMHLLVLRVVARVCRGLYLVLRVGQPYRFAIGIYRACQTFPREEHFGDIFRPAVAPVLSDVFQALAYLIVAKDGDHLGLHYF